MSKLPAAQQYIGKGLDLPMPMYVLPDTCCNPTCDAPAFDLHHVTRRSFLAGAFNYVELFGRVWLNLAQVCRSCHDDLEQNRVQIAANLEGSSGYYSWAGRRLDPYPNPVLEDGESHGSPSSSTGESNPSSNVRGGTDGEEGRAPVLPGSTCPQCNRRVPHPRKPSSPKSKVYGMRVPVDEHDTFAEVVDAAAEHLGVKEQPHHRFKTLSLAAALVLQDAELRDFGKR